MKAAIVKWINEHRMISMGSAVGIVFGLMLVMAGLVVMLVEQL